MAYVKSRFWPLALSLVLLVYVTSLTNASDLKKFSPPEMLAPAPELRHFTFGQKLAWVDLLWVRALQDFDTCEKLGAEDGCRQKGWLFQVLDFITDLDPGHRMAFSAGGSGLSVILSDIAGASKIFDKGVQALPHDWVLLYKAAYHALAEEKNTEKAAGLMLRAAQNGAPDWVFALSGRLYTDAGKKELAQKIYEDMVQMGLPEGVLARLRQKIESAD